MGPDVVYEEFFNYLQEHADHPEWWPNLYTDVDDFMIKYHLAGQAQDDIFRASPPPQGDGLGLSVPGPDQMRPLIDLA